MHLRKQLKSKWLEVSGTIGKDPKQIWLPVGSGTLVKTFDQILNSKITIQAVNVHVLPADDKRITELVYKPRVKMISAPMPFHEMAKNLPGVPSNIFYDAKLWEFIEKFSEDGDVWWNVAR
ncbi:MAG: hypothetical protein A4S09_03525 [Proteobacteria bacterium SG_bin7]|nr:MAG: hypothetical protein A4S09_03525 [Proteobacteria bacterium SG_bin7]